MTEADLLRSLHSTEHTFVERKTVGDSRDWVKTVVAFANSLETNQEGVLFIGATDKGEIESNPANLDKLQKTLSEKLQSVYPPVYYTTKIVAADGRECLAVIVPGSSSKPHYSGPLYLRDGSQTVIATGDSMTCCSRYDWGKPGSFSSGLGNLSRCEGSIEERAWDTRSNRMKMRRRYWRVTSFT